MGLMKRVVLGLALTTSVLSAESVKDARDRAHAKKDYPAFLALSRRLVELAPRSVGALYNVACAEALLGHEAEAAAVLTRLAGMGLAPDAAADSDFDRVRDAAVVQRAFGRLAENRTPIERSAVAFTLPEKGLITEGVAYDPKTGAFFVSSVRERKVVRRDASGRLTDFVSPRQDGLLAAVGLAVDPAPRSLWVSSAAMSQMEGYSKDQEGQSLVWSMTSTRGASAVSSCLRMPRPALRISRSARGASWSSPTLSPAGSIGGRTTRFASSSIGGHWALPRGWRSAPTGISTWPTTPRVPRG